MAAKRTKIYKQIERCYTRVMNGTLLSIDPSIGSRSSVPGYALFVNGNLVDKGTLRINPALAQNKKLYELNRVLREDFMVPDVVAVEDIPPISFNRANPMTGQSLVSLQRAVGAICAAFPVDDFLLVHPRSWQAYKPEDYEKTDVWDAICIGLCCIGVANKIAKENG